MPTLKTVTLGCKVNQYETQWVREALARLGYEDSPDARPADLCVVNTCTVTAEADRKSRKLIRQMARENPGTRIVVMGCYATRRPEEAAALPGVCEVITDKRRLPEWLARLGLHELPTGVTSFDGRSRAYVKIQDGCRMECAYCVIPRTRPVLESRPIPHVLDEIRRLVDAGYREIVLTGIHLGYYGVDLVEEDDRLLTRKPSRDREGAVFECNKVQPLPHGRGSVLESRGSEHIVNFGEYATSSSPPTLASLLREIAQLDGAFRVRISSMEAAEVTDELLDVMAEHPERICPHLHVSMQSGSDDVLRRMRRHYTSGQFIERCERIKRRLDRPGLTTDVIVGFPGETEADFEATCRVVRQVGFSKIHVFRFSPRPGTAAEKMPDPVPGEVQQRRSMRLARIEQDLRTAYFEGLLGEPLWVLVESIAVDRSGYLLGTSARYVPVVLPGGADRVGQLVRATAQSVENGQIWAEPT
ncbi:MAG TPA: MiaB/RimO family radical SAM methylthiotransferase [Thermoguttaceae bacterium]|nr:MiaB/RimO family radical SAM methylthiotransferase [Thermoguttaceae bacterium]